MLLAASLAAGAALAQQALVCPPSGSNEPCHAYHWHAQMYRPDTKQFVEVIGTDLFASQSACDRARDLEVKRNGAVVDYFRKKGDARYEADRFGPCHCDATTDAQKAVQWKNVEEAHWRVRERLLDSGVTSDNELVRGLWADIPRSALLGGPKLVPLPQAAPLPPLVSPEDLRATKPSDLPKAGESKLELPLADLAAPAAPPSAPGDNAAIESFIALEQERVQNVLKSSGAITDDEAKGKIFEASMQRLALLSNLRQIIEAAGSRSRIAAAARAAQSEAERLALITRLFGENVAPHWAASDPAQVVVDPVGADPERILRDATGQFSETQKRHALYAFLAQAQPTDEQRLWLVNVIDSLLGDDMPADEASKEVMFGRKYFELGEYGSAYDHFAKADALRADQPALLYDLALALTKAGRYAEAQTKVDRYLQLFPGGAEKPLITKLMFELEFQRELQKKRQAEQEYVDLFNRASFAYARGELDAALKLFQQAEQVRATDAAAIFNQGMTLEKQGELAKAVERYKKSAELEPNAAADQRVLALEHELEEMRTKIVCSFCGTKLPIGTTWCPRCWHGPYVNSGIWDSRVCSGPAKTSRTTYFAGDRVAKVEELGCLLEGSSLVEALRYTPAKQRAIQDARKAEGWTYSGSALAALRDQLVYVQGADYLESVTATPTGETLNYAAHDGGGGVWLLDREDLAVDAMRYTNHYAYDEANRIAQETVDYQNPAGCNHIITIKADFSYARQLLLSAKISGGYEGLPAEGSPSTKWQATVAYTWDPNDPAGHLMKEELAVTSWVKIYQQRPAGALRDEMQLVYPTMKPKQPLDGFLRGDVCALNGTYGLLNPVDLRALYVMSPNLSFLLPNGVNRAVVTFSK
jgi:tetratricopeptide (TPR) repeat protein